MKRLDRYLQRVRIAQALPWVRAGDRLLDAGCYDDSLLRRAAPRVRRAAGIDPLARDERRGDIELHSGELPARHPFGPGEFDCITLLAVLEHHPKPEQLARELARLLAPAGRVVLTVPRPVVDRMLDALKALRLIDGMSLEEHHGFDWERTQALFEAAGLRLVARRSFELGLNRLYVFEKPAAGIVRDD